MAHKGRGGMEVFIGEESNVRIVLGAYVQYYLPSDTKAASYVQV